MQRFPISFLSIYNEAVLINAGLISRMAMLFIVSLWYRRVAPNMKFSILYAFYFICMIAYVAIPFEMVLGRLMNNVRIMDILFIPFIFYSYLASEVKNKNIYMGRNTVIFKRKASNNIRAIVCVVVYSAMYVFQLLTSVGYDVYTHIFI